MILLIAIVIGLAAHREGSWSRCEVWLRSRLAPCAIGVVSAVAFWYMAHGDFDPPPVISDEASYQLQASLFANGRWADSSSPHREAFRQMHVLDTPIVTSKYPPGHALVLTPGYLIGLPFLMPLLFAAMAGVLCFLLARTFFGPGAALLAWLSWLGASGTATWRLTWFSESTSGTLMLLGWWLLWQGPVTPRRAWVLGLTTGLLAITRPLTAVVFVVPIAALLVRDAWQNRRVGHIVRASVGSLPLLAVLPLWASQTTGHVAATPLAEYTRLHMPWDRIGFGWDTTTPPLPLSGDQLAVQKFFEGVHAEHRPERYFVNVLERGQRFVTQHIPGRWIVLAVVCIPGVLLLHPVLLATAGLQFLAYGLYAHARNWTVYYAELGPLVAISIGAGTWWCIQRLGPRRQLAAFAMTTTMMTAIAWNQVRIEREHVVSRTREAAAFRALTRELPHRSIVFVKYAPGHEAHRALITNLAPRDKQPVLTAYDRGTSANLLLAQDLARVPYLFLEGEGSLAPLSPADTSSGSGTVPTAP